MQGSPLTEADLKALARFKHLRSLGLIDTGIRDASLNSLRLLAEIITSAEAVGAISGATVTA